MNSCPCCAVIQELSCLCEHKWGRHFMNMGCRASQLIHPALWGTHAVCQAPYTCMYIPGGVESAWVSVCNCAHACKCLVVHVCTLACEFCMCVSLYVDLGVCVCINFLHTHGCAWVCVCVLSELVIPVSTLLLESGLLG